MDIIFKSIVGSQAYGTNTPESDIDIKGVYVQPLEDIMGFNYQQQVDVSKDECYFEIKRFLELAMTANPTMLELMFMPKECILIKDKRWDLIVEHRHMFLTKQARKSFGGYAVQQIQKAEGLNKKMNWEKDRVERKTIIDFCYISLKGKSVLLSKYLKDENIDPQFCGMVKLDHMADNYAMYHDTVSQWAKDGNHRFKDEGGEIPSLGFRGIESKDGNQLICSNVPKYTIPCEGTIYFNKSEWGKHCADYQAYTTWIANRNTARYVDSQEHGQKIDGKNLMHCRRLIDTAIEIATTGDLKVKRDNAKYLLSIRKGEVKLKDIIEQAKRDLERVDELFEKSTLPDKCDPKLVNELLVKIRKMTEQEKEERKPMIKKKIDEEMVAARKAKDSLKLATLIAVKVPFDAIAKENSAAPESDYMNALKKVISQYRETATYAIAGSRDALFQTARNSYTLLESYLPQELTEDEVEVMLHNVAKENQLDITKKNMGQLVKLTVAKSEGRTDGKMVSTILNGILTQYSA